MSLDMRRFHGNFEAAVRFYSLRGFTGYVLLWLALFDPSQLFSRFHRAFAFRLAIVFTVFITLTFHFYHLRGVAGAASYKHRNAIRS